MTAFRLPVSTNSGEHEMEMEMIQSFFGGLSDVPLGVAYVVSMFAVIIFRPQ
jgi:hypothetical protein